MDTDHIFYILNQNYDINILNIELFREGGNISYIIYERTRKFFLKIMRPPFIETGLYSIDIQMYLLENKFPVVPVILTKTGDSYIRIDEQFGKYIFILYEYINGEEPYPEDTEKTGALIGKLHKIMNNFTGQLPVKGKHFFIERYVELMKKMNYARVDDFSRYGDELWENVKNLPRGFCHCDLYRGNIHRVNSESMYVLDFDTSCHAFPMYDIALFCNDTHWFNYDDSGYEKSNARLKQFLKGYHRYCLLTEKEISAFYDLIAVYHYQLQATMIEIHGQDCVDSNYFDSQYDWLIRWKKQCGGYNTNQYR